MENRLGVVPISLLEAAGESPECDLKPPLGASLLIFPRGYPLMSFPQVDTSTR